MQEAYFKDQFRMEHWNIVFLLFPAGVGWLPASELLVAFSPWRVLLGLVLPTCVGLAESSNNFPLETCDLP